MIKVTTQDDQEYNEKSQYEWMKNLRVGDTVCDCRFKHITIASIHESYIVKFPNWLKNIVFADWMPFRIGNFLDDLFCMISRKIGNIELSDKDLVLEDGAHCSAMHCCNPPEHLWDHPQSQ